jgi:hypothetical protein
MNGPIAFRHESGRPERILLEFRDLLAHVCWMRDSATTVRRIISVDLSAVYWASIQRIMQNGMTRLLGSTLSSRNSELRPQIHDLSGFGERQSRSKFYALFADTFFFQHGDNSRKKVFLGRFSRSHGLTIDALIARPMSSNHCYKHE